MTTTTSTFHAIMHNLMDQAYRVACGLPLPPRGWAVCPRPDMGHLTHTGALLGAKQAGLAPRELAQAWLEAMPEHVWIAQSNIAGPGHVNIQLTDAGWAAAIGSGLTAFDTPPAPPATLLEFVSANPTGPLHLGHARQAVLGDVLGKLLRTLNGTVGTEFFYNDAGVQIDMLQQSVRLRALECAGHTLVFARDGATETDVPVGGHLFPADGYHGAYITEIAQAFLTAGHDVGDAQRVRTFSVAAMQADQQADLAWMGVHFDGWVSERSLFERGLVRDVVQAWGPHLYTALAPKVGSLPQGGTPPVHPATFLATSALGDDKDRVALKSDGTPTYFVPDVAYHVDKHARGWARAINVQGADHHGTLARVQAGVQLANPSIGPNYPQVVFHTMIKVVKNGVPVQASKRAGDYLTAREVAEQVGMDAFRMAMLDKKPDSPMTLDVDAWLAQSASNPVYSVQYAHARLCAALDKVAETAEGGVVSAPWLPAECTLATQVVLLGSRIQQAAVDTDPVRVATLAKELAQAVHGAYQKGPKLWSLGGPARASRVQLFEAARAGLAHLGQLLGVVCPQRMPQRDKGGDALAGSDGCYDDTPPPRIKAP